MKSIKVNLSSDGLDKVLDFLDDKIADLDKAEKDMVSELAFYGKKQALTYLNAIVDFDGNDVGMINTNVTGNKAVIEHVGHDVGFLEYGTGIVGKENPHPAANEVGWEYDIDTIHKRNFKDGRGWFYKDSIYGTRVRTHGMVGARHMYKASVDLRSRLNILKRRIIR